MEETNLYDIYLRAFVMGRMQVLVKERRDMADHVDDGHGRFDVRAYEGQKLAAFAIGLADGGMNNAFPRPKAELQNQLTRLGA
ncbi:hypothetical protein [Corallococcus exercitus]|uniref:Uncharacterized protein n=1 Tax=Corallococcus exercitus TaxID=2316736 RepID=A0A7Y4JN69_9BACT|nr:hypothetical protein [Corallococcus exercitus]NOK08090.1 hypothetical protein [Corallococcus exercitus]